MRDAFAPFLLPLVLAGASGCVRPRSNSAAPNGRRPRAVARAGLRSLPRKALYYLPDRLLDIVDLVEIGVGWGYGPEARVRAGRVAALGAGWHAGGMVGVKSRSQWGGWFEDRITYRAGPLGNWESRSRMVQAELVTAPFPPVVLSPPGVALGLFYDRVLNGREPGDVPEQLDFGEEHFLYDGMLAEAPLWRENLGARGDAEGPRGEIEVSCAIPLILFSRPGHVGKAKDSLWWPLFVKGNVLHNAAAWCTRAAYAICGPSARVQIRLHELPDMLAGWVGLDPKEDDLGTTAKPAAEAVPKTE